MGVLLEITKREDAKFSILIAEDVPVQAKKLQYILTKFGYDVTWCENGKVALEALEKKDYHLVISDYQMPVMDGLEFLDIIKANGKFKKIPFILLTTIEDDNLFLKSLNLGANEYLSKPYRTEELKLRCNNLIMLYEYQRLVELENKGLSQELVKKNAILEDNLHKLNEAHKQLIEMQEQLIISSKMASLGTLGAGMAHEINNPLTIIQAYNGRLKKVIEREEFEEERLLKINENIDTAVKRITSIIKHLKNFADGHSTTHEEFSKLDPQVVLEDLSDFYGGLVKRNDITVVKDFSAQNFCITGYKTLLEQIFLNLIHNAIDAMETTEKKILSLSTYIEDGKKYVILVSDTGTGIPPEILKNIYDPFFTTKAPGKGTGLGMSLVQSYLKECKGSIDCKSIPGNTNFFIIFDAIIKDSPTSSTDKKNE